MASTRCPLCRTAARPSGHCPALGHGRSVPVCCGTKRQVGDLVSTGLHGTWPRLAGTSARRRSSAGRSGDLRFLLPLPAGADRGTAARHPRRASTPPGGSARRPGAQTDADVERASTVPGGDLRDSQPRHHLRACGRADAAARAAGQRSSGKSLETQTPRGPARSSDAGARRRAASHRASAPAARPESASPRGAPRAYIRAAPAGLQGPGARGIRLETGEEATVPRFGRGRGPRGLIAPRVILP